MGTITYHKPVGVKAVDSIKDNALGREWCEKHLVAITATREAVFAVGKFHEPDNAVYVPDSDGYVRALLVFKLAISPRSWDNFGYKDMTETMGPYGCEAPLSIIAKCSELRDPIGPEPRWSSLSSAREYRERSKRFAATKALKRALKPGTKIKLAKPLKFSGNSYDTFIVDRRRVRGRKGESTVFVPERNLYMLCHIRAANLEGATIIEKSS